MVIQIVIDPPKNMAKYTFTIIKPKIDLDNIRRVYSEVIVWDQWALTLIPTLLALFSL